MTMKLADRGCIEGQVGNGGGLREWTCGEHAQQSKARKAWSRRARKLLTHHVSAEGEENSVGSAATPESHRPREAARSKARTRGCGGEWQPGSEG